MPLHPLHALFGLEVFAFLYLVEQRRFSSVFQASVVHGIVALGILLGTFALQFASASPGADGIGEVMAAAIVTLALALVVVVSWVVAGVLSRRHRQEQEAAVTSA